MLNDLCLTWIGYSLGSVGVATMKALTWWFCLCFIAEWGNSWEGEN